MTTLTTESTSIKKVLHNLRGSVFNITGFQSELNEAFSQLQELVDHYHDNFPESGKEEFRNIFKNDINHCLMYTSKSLVALSEQMDELEHVLRGGDGG